MCCRGLLRSPAAVVGGLAVKRSRPPAARARPAFPFGLTPEAAALLLIVRLLAGAPVNVAAAADGAGNPPATLRTLTEPGQAWALPTAEKSIVHPLRLEGRVSYFDPRWRNFWLEKNGVGDYLLLSTNPPKLRQGQHVVIEGTILPAKGLDADAVTVTVLRENEPADTVNAAGRIGDRAALNGRNVLVRGYVDAQRVTDVDHFRLSLIVDDHPVIGWVKPADPNALPNLVGSFVELRGLYQARFDPTQTRETIEIWTGDYRDVTVLGTIAESPRFEAPATPINEISLAAEGREIRVRGRVLSIDPGSSVTVRDDTGQVLIQTAQQVRAPAGTEVDAIGLTAFRDSEWILRSGLVRLVPASPRPHPAAAGPPAVLENVDQIRQLSVEEAARGRPVAIAGAVVWSLPDADFFFLQDLSGGIRVHFRRDQMDAPLRNKYLQITGVTYNGGFAPAVELAGYKDLGTLSEPPIKDITYDQAITGEQDGQLIAMRGFYQRTESDGDIRRIHAITPSGEIIGLLDAPVYAEPVPGSLIRIRGACEMVTDENGRITGILLRMMSPPGVEDAAPADKFDLPLRSIKSLRQLSTAKDLTRVRVAGVVLHATPGSHVYLQDERAALLLLSRETAPLAPGDRIEAVGILGWEGVRTVLREAAFRKAGSGPPPLPERLDNPARLTLAFDSRLVSVRGSLIDFIRRPGQPVRLTLQAGPTLFEAVLDEPGFSHAPLALDLGAGLDLTGIYRLVFDDSRQSRSFQLHLRSPQDIAVFQPAQVWTLRRAFLALAFLGGCLLIGMAWVIALRRRVRQQTTQIRAQLERQAQLEAEVERATRLESLGVLAGGIAHDFNNLLTIVLGNLSLVMMDEKVMALAGDALRDGQRGAVRARDLTQQLLTFAKGGNPLRAAVSLSRIVQETTDFVLHGSKVRCEYAIDPDLWPADVDRNQIAQVIQNLAINAVQAMPLGGILRIALHNDEVAPGRRTALAAGRYLRLDVADTGEGINPEVLPRIFDPYFSTRKGGSGLGLATVYSIVKKHQGHIEVDAKPGEGAQFTVWLPAASEAARASTPPVPAGAGEPLGDGNPARVLLMDDEESIRRLGAALLQRMNLEATVVADGAEAVRAFREARGAGRPYDLLILDLTIPGGMGGREAIEQIRTIDPDVPAIVSSGYSNDPVLAEFDRHGFQAMVSKPYEVTTLGDTIRRLLAPHAGARR